MKKNGAVLLVILLVMAAGVLGETLSIGSKGSEVLKAKERLRDLGYYKQGTKLSRSYTEDTAKKTEAFQAVNGLEITGELTDEEQALLYSDEALSMPVPTPEPFATPAPTPAVAYPARDEEGYAAGNSPFFYENPEDGLWVAITHDLQITITRREDDSYPLVWFETDILFRKDGHMGSHGQKRYMHPYDIAQENGFILAFSDDFYGYRTDNREKTGIIIRNSELLFDQPASRSNYGYPNLDMLAEYPGGILKTYTASGITAQELLDKGAINVLSFGPIVIQNGEINSKSLLSGYYSSKEPRQVLGMIEPGHYFLVTVVGRSSKSRGTDLWHVAGILKEHNVQEALNLDGGNTAALVFRGKLLNKEGNTKAARTVNSLLYFGQEEEAK